MAAIKVPPHSEEAEQSVLGSILIDKDAISVVSEVIKPEDFYNDTNKIIYESMLELFENRKPIDLLTLSEILKKKKVFDKVGSAYLMDLVNIVPTAANVEEYAFIIKESSTRRFLIRSSSKIAEMAFQEIDIKQVI